MKPTQPRSESTTTLPVYPAITVGPLREDEAQQDQMRRLHNARASQRAARYHRINRVSAI
ncbi:hypothetical protein FV228_00080 [Methylobacterium sp. WL18]|uniref:hypothetical protein n=1 Tax=Methylobacterium sp. WL18 TaxID=2603897 RepID=UPI0011C9062E|nr:hypothetical protein [Methylobacterium sp. WL18]TXN76587.1 hypothetical protein FV228_00080 [Methylobacterium sp. WL18]